jgi:hypothetical protein
MEKGFMKKALGALRDLARWLVPIQMMYFLLKVTSTNNTFAGKVRQRLAYDRRPTLVTFVDKVAVRDYCRNKSTSIRIPEIYQVAETPDELDPRLWPEEFVLKPSFGSGAVVMVTKSPKFGLNYDIQPKMFRWDHGYQGVLSAQFDLQRIRNLAGDWLESNYEYWTFKFPEWAYRDVPRRVIVEEIVRNLDGSPPTDFRIHCFHGKVAMIRVTDWEKRAWCFDRLGNPINARLSWDRPVAPNPGALHTFWKDAVREAELISKGIDYIRVDFNLTDEGVYFSELTPYPNGGLADFAPKETSQWLASLWGSTPVNPKQ